MNFEGKNSYLGRSWQPGHFVQLFYSACHWNWDAEVKLHVDRLVVDDF